MEHEQQPRPRRPTWRSPESGWTGLEKVQLVLIVLTIAIGIVNLTGRRWVGAAAMLAVAASQVVLLVDRRRRAGDEPAPPA